MFEWLHDHTSIYMVQSIRRENSQSEKKLGKFILLSNDPPMPTKAVKELNGKRKRDDKQVIPFSSGNYSSLRLQNGTTHKHIFVSSFFELINV